MSILEQAQAIQEEIVANRRTIHKNPELGLDLPKTVAFVKEKLIEMGYTPEDCGKSGVVATIGKPGKTLPTLNLSLQTIGCTAAATIPTPQCC